MKTTGRPPEGRVRMVIYVLPQVKNKLLGMKGTRPVGHIIEELVIPEWKAVPASGNDPVTA